MDRSLLLSVFIVVVSGICLNKSALSTAENTNVVQENQEDWVNLSKRGGKDVVFLGLAGLLQGISQERSPREIPEIPFCNSGCYPDVYKKQ